MILFCNQERLDRLLGKIRDSSHSDFYRKHLDTSLYSNQLSELPFLTRADIASITPEDRCYTDHSELVFTAYTSGTSSQQPLLLYFGQVENYFFDPSLGQTVQNLFILYPPLLKSFNASFVQQCQQSAQSLLCSFGDIHNLALSGALMSKFRCDTLYATPTLARRFAEYITTTDVKLLVIASEMATASTVRQLEKLYPKAIVVNLYASAEIGQFIMGPTPDMISCGESGFVPNQQALIAAELEDSELVLTYDLNPAFPLIRYRTGDTFRIIKKNDETELPILQFDGRHGVDVVRVAGFELRAGTLDECMKTLGFLPYEYQLHIMQTATGGVSFCLEVIQTAAAIKNADSNLNDYILDSLYLSQSYPLRKAIVDDLIEELSVMEVAFLSNSGDKRRPLVSHL